MTLDGAAAGRRPRLSDVARLFRQGDASGEELSAAFLEARVFCRRGEELGFLAAGDAGNGWIPAFSSDLALARSEGACAWFSAPGAEVIELVPDGYGIALDPGSDTEVYLAPWAVKPAETELDTQSEGRQSGTD